MSETELSVICKNCGSEVSPYVTECPYCGARLRKRAPKLERRGDALEAQRPRRRLLPSRPALLVADRPYATLVVILGSAIMLLIQEATGYELFSFGGLLVPFQEEGWRYLTAPFAYGDVGYLFVVALALAIFSTGVERRLGTTLTALLLVACGSLGMLAAVGFANSQDDIVLLAGGNGTALGMLAAWAALRRAEARGAIDQEVDWIGVAVCAVVLLALPIFTSADFFAGLGGAVVGGLAGLAATARLSHQ
jgi:membrane associated rhomboid family serine protease